MQNKLVALSMHIAENPNDAAAYVERGRLCAEKGMTDEALRDYTKAIEANLNETSALYNLSLIHTFKENDLHSSKIQRAYQNKGGLDKRKQALVTYALAKYNHDIDNTENAFSLYKEAGMLMRDFQGYTQRSRQLKFNSVKHIFPDGFKAPTTPNITGQIPIFIVGLPRSGTTLLESMIGMHSNTYPAGELNLFPQTIGDIQNYYGGKFVLKKNIYLDGIKKLTPSPFVIDKLPYNFMAIPFINLMFPNAPILHIQRDPLDTLFSCFTTCFDNENAWTYALEDLAHYYNCYHDLMEQWRRNGWNFLDVNYEDLVNNPEEELKRILEYCGLEFEPQCLEFYKSDRIVKTASATQVRKPLYKSSIGRAEKYKEHLRPLIDILDNRRVNMPT